jgi:hypothetical protein
MTRAEEYAQVLKAIVTPDLVQFVVEAAFDVPPLTIFEEERRVRLVTNILTIAANMSKRGA